MRLCRKFSRFGLRQVSMYQDTIGLIGGFGGYATLDFYKRLCEIISDMTAYELTKRLFIDHDILIKDLTGRLSGGRQYIKLSVRSGEENRELADAIRSVFGMPAGDGDRSGRIVGDKCDISNEDTRRFFEERTQKQLPHRYNYLIYQDSDPELALERDGYEKRKMMPYMSVKGDSRILDIGCGVER